MDIRRKLYFCMRLSFGGLLAGAMLLAGGCSKDDAPTDEKTDTDEEAGGNDDADKPELKLDIEMVRIKEGGHFPDGKPGR